MPLQGDITELLQRSRTGDREALDRVLPLVYDELRRLAQSYLSRERKDHTLQATALVHEAYLRLVGQREVDWQNRAQFLGLAAQMMRRILLTHAEARNAEKRQAYTNRVSLDDALQVFEQRCDIDVIQLDRVLTRLSEMDSRQAQIVELRCFGGLSIEETSEVLSISPATVKREWSVARLWLRKELSA